MRVREKIVLRVVAKVLIPFILLFALYVQFHGDFGPGGGFQAGAIFGAGFILYAMIFGADPLRGVAPPVVVEIGVALGVLLFAGVGVASLFLGGNYLDYGVFDPQHPARGQHLGILLVELGVGITVASVITTIFSCFAERGRRR